MFLTHVREHVNCQLRSLFASESLVHLGFDFDFGIREHHDLNSKNSRYLRLRPPRARMLTSESRQQIILQKQPIRVTLKSRRLKISRTPNFACQWK